EGQVKAARDQVAWRLRSRRRAPAGDAEGGRAAQAPGGDQGRQRRRAGRTAERPGDREMSVLVLVEHDGSHIKDATLAAVTAASKLGEVHALVAGKDVTGVAEAAAKIAGIGKVLVADAPHLDHELAENVAPVAAKLMDGYDAFVAPATTFGKNIAPRVAALIDVMQVSDVIGIDDASTFVRPIYAGNAIATVKSKDAKKVI